MNMKRSKARLNLQLYSTIIWPQMSCINGKLAYDPIVLK